MSLIEIEWTWQIKRQTILHTYLKYLEPPYDKQNWLDLSSGSHHALKNPAHWLPSCSQQLDVFNPLGLTFFQFFHPPTDSFEVIVHIDTQRPLQLCYTFAVAPVQRFVYAAVLDLHDGQKMLSGACSYLVRCVAFNAPCMQHRGSAGSGRLTAIPDSQGLGASHLNGVLFWKKVFRVATLFCWKLVPWELPEVSASYMSDIWLRWLYLDLILRRQR